jgi:hypothetical protein
MVRPMITSTLPSGQLVDACRRMNEVVAKLPALGCFITASGREIMLDGAAAIRPGEQSYREALSQLVRIADETGTDLMAEVGEFSMYPTAWKAMTEFLAEFEFIQDKGRSNRCVYRKSRASDLCAADADSADQAGQPG